MSGEKLKNIFNPTSVAVIGASEKKGSVGKDLMENLLDGFKGNVYPINPKHDSILGIESYGNVKDVEKKIDLAVIAIPSSSVPDVLEDCGEANIKSSIIISAGFSESGSKGQRLEERLEEIREKYEIRIMGPNCMGVLSPLSDLNLSFLKKKPKKGEIAFVSQSGALGSAVLDWSTEANVGFSDFVSVGNMLDIDFADLIEYFGEDENTKAILLYIEGISNPDRFLRKAQKVSEEKPIFVLKSGKYSRSAEAVASHTGSLAGEDEVYNAVFNRTDITRLNNIEEFLDCAEYLSREDLPQGSNVLIVTNAGGPGVLATDAILDRGGEMASLSKKIISELRNILPEGANTSNPVDVLGDAGKDRYKKAIEICSKDDDVDGIIVIYTPQGSASSKDVAEALVELKDIVDKPIIASWMGGDKITSGKKPLEQNGIVSFDTPERAVSAYMKMYENMRNRDFLSDINDEEFGRIDKSEESLHEKISEMVEEDRYVMTEVESKEFLESFGIPTSTTRVAGGKEELSEIAEDIGYPVAMKVHSQDISHKSDVGGVELGLENEEELENTYDRILKKVKNNRPEADILGVTIQEMVDMDYGLIFGLKRDPIFGPVIMFGRGGRDVELYNDTALDLSPLNGILARNLIQRTDIYQFLKGYRDYPTVDIEELIDYLVRFSYLLEEFPRINEVDINPFAVENGKLLAIDARIILNKS